MPRRAPTILDRSGPGRDGCRKSRAKVTDSATTADAPNGDTARSFGLDGGRRAAAPNNGAEARQRDNPIARHAQERQMRPAWVYSWTALLAASLLVTWDRIGDAPPGDPIATRAVIAIVIFVPLLDSLYWLRGRTGRAHIRPIPFDAGQSLRMALASVLPLVLYLAGVLSDLQFALLATATLAPEWLYVLPPAMLHHFVSRRHARRTEQPYAPHPASR